jgi:hypothetical protein
LAFFKVLMGPVNRLTIVVGAAIRRQHRAGAAQHVTRLKKVALDWPEDVTVVVANSSPPQPSVFRFGKDASCVKANETMVRLAALP